MPNGLVATPPLIVPARWEDFEGFRETTLAAITDPAANTAMRATGQLVYRMAVRHDWPHPALDEVHHEARAALADLRFLEGYVRRHLGRAHEVADLPTREAMLSRACAPLADRLHEIADTLAALLAGTGERPRCQGSV